MIRFLRAVHSRIALTAIAFLSVLASAIATVDLAHAEYVVIRYVVAPTMEKGCTLEAIDDGDTFDVSCKSNGDIRYYPNVRMIGINAPDLERTPEYAKKRCYYDEARKSLSSVKARTFSVQFFGSDLCKDSDKGCRNLVRLIDEKSGVDINEWLVLQGLAFSWTNFSSIPYDLKLRYVRAESFARESKNGLWAKCGINYNPAAKPDTASPTKMTKYLAWLTP